MTGRAALAARAYNGRIAAMRTPFAERLARYAADPAAPEAIVLPDGEISYAELQRRVEHAAAWMRAQGCAAGGIVGITIADEIAHLTVSLACLVLGLPQICLPTYEPRAVRDKLARALGVARVIAADPEHALPGIAVSLVAPASLAQPRRVPAQDALDADPATIALFVASSGSTGDPKRRARRGCPTSRRRPSSAIPMPSSSRGRASSRRPARPPERVLRLNREFNAMLASPDVRERFAQLGLEPIVGSTPERFASDIRAQVARWPAIVKAAGLKKD